MEHRVFGKLHRSLTVAALMRFSAQVTKCQTSETAICAIASLAVPLLGLAAEPLVALMHVIRAATVRDGPRLALRLRPDSSP